MRILVQALILFISPMTAFACLTPAEPSFDWMIKESTLILRGQVFRMAAQGNSDGVNQYVSDIVIERVYKGIPPSLVRVNWKESSMCPRARLTKDQYGLFFLRANGSEFVIARWRGWWQSEGEKKYGRRVMESSR